jgi:hypothetical protein
MNESQLSPRNTPSKRGKWSRQECSQCHYALYPNTGRCTNHECPRSRRESGALSVTQLMHEYAEPELFHGRRWGSWTLDIERLCLVFEGQPVERGNGSGVTTGVPGYVAFIGGDEVDLERIRDSASALDWIFQLGGKVWATARVTRDLLNALDDVIHPQANLCSGAIGGCAGKTIAKPRKFLRQRIATVGKRGAK